MKYLVISPFFFFTFIFHLQAQQQEYSQQQLDSLKRAVFNLQQDVEQVQLNLYNSKKTLKTGIFIATLGYTVTIIGGQLLGTNPDVGEALLYTGGAIGIAGTIVLVKGFNKISLGPPK
ncbi:hypothetical protein GCM10011506_17920 [Marivirga lumbricoides]|uniref:Uncharacterized protein n=1 Tax=Marivirga lumbricoides TaxID=1046115 RepID=A0ABQ1M062_9BACT|nr:hypothetical protein GCM10011506_17920 [Marivirga lumbricoides]